MPGNDEAAPPRPLKISWWRVAVGLILVLVEIKNWLTPNQDFPDALRASNETQQGAIYLVSCVIFLVGIGFIVAGLRSLWLKRS
jgi:uncharacterized membrane protein YcjF (UPF0283 family)